MAMMQKHTFFREKAIQKYVQSREKNVLPRLVSPPTFALLWIILVTMIAAGILSWLGQTPRYVTASGLILDQRATGAGGKDEAVALIFLPATSPLQVRAGMPAQLQIGAAGLQVTGTIGTVEPTILSPSQIHQLYTFEVTDPEFVATITLGPTISGRLFAGSPVQAQIQVGSQRLFALLPFFGTLLS
jgi:hypothetical protein